MVYTNHHFSSFSGFGNHRIRKAEKSKPHDPTQITFPGTANENESENYRILINPDYPILDLHHSS